MSKNTIITADGIHNVMTGIGSMHSKRAHNHYDFTFMNNYMQQEAAYQTDWLARAIVDYPAEDMVREWRTIKGQDADKLQLAERKYRIKTAVEDALRWARLYGGSGMIMMTDQPLDKPLNVERIKRGSLKNLVVFDRYTLSAPIMNVTNPLAENYMLPEIYFLNGGMQPIHHSHVVRFTGAPLPYRLRMQTSGWGDSELRKALDQVMDYTSSNAGLAELMAEANVDIITREGLTDEIASDQEGKIIERYAAFNQMKSIVQMALLDKEEVYDRKTLNLSGVAPIIEMFMIACSGASGIPMTRLFGVQAAGLGNDGKGDMNNYHNHLASKQNSQLDSSMWRLDEVFVRSTLGYYPDDFSYEWNPFEQLNGKEIQEERKLEAETNLLYLQNGVITTSQIQRNLQSKGEYQFNDEDIEALENAEGEFNDEETEDLPT